MDAFFSGAGASPGPLTLVSRFFADGTPDSDQRSFTQLLAGAIASPLARPTLAFDGAWDKEREKDSSSASPASFGFKQSRPFNLVVANPQSLLMISPGVSTSGLLN